MSAVIQSKPRPVSWARDFYASQLGKKAVMAVTGIAIFGFAMFHMVGLMKVYIGRDPLNHYSEWLRNLLVPFLPRTVTLWHLRIGLIAAVVLHVVAAAQLTIANRRARPERYATRTDYIAANYASRTMRWTGVIVGLFIVYHLMNLSWGNAHPDFVRGDAYHNMLVAFRSWPVSAVYIVANLALGLHIYHGLWSLFQSLGLNNPRFNAWRTYFAQAFSVILTVGYVSFPVTVLAGVVK